MEYTVFCDESINRGAYFSNFYGGALVNEESFFILYYQFIKHSFGFMTNTSFNDDNLKLYFDKIPDTKEKTNKFKDFIFDLNRHLNPRGLHIKKEDIAEITSHDHDILQCLDVILGAMAFRLNDLHKQKIAGTSRRGKKTIAKERLYKHINKLIREKYANFNIGSSTGKREGDNSSWTMTYSHWRFKPSKFAFDSTFTK